MDDVWRVALTILDAIHMFNMPLEHFSELPANQIMDAITPSSYPMDSVKEVVATELAILQKKMKISPSDLQYFQNVLIKMLDREPSNRLTLDELVTRAPFSVCLKRKDFLMPRMSMSRRNGKNACRRLSQELTTKLKRN